MNLTTILLVLRAISALAAFWFVYKAASAGKKFHNPRLVIFALAIGFIGLALTTEVVAVVLFGVGLGLAEVIEASLALIGFGILIWAVGRKSE